MRPCLGIDVSLCLLFLFGVESVVACFDDLVLSILNLHFQFANFNLLFYSEISTIASIFSVSCFGKFLLMMIK
ncbi:hypothetical protein M758_2G143400 [Ceratodon purpureus]|nr:hypothetical protein M758_2G143400 [Ceratodon purpureus]